MQNKPLSFQPLEYAYFTIAIFNLLAVFIQYQPLIFATKPLLMCLLGLYFHQTTAPKKWNFAFFITAGLGASIFGDTFLLGSSDGYFTAGLLSFLIAHLCYFVGFSQYKSTKQGLLWTQYWWIAPFMLFWFTMNYLLWNKTGDLRLPVLIYSAVITAMSIGVVHLQGKTAAKLLLLGVLCFVVSDSFIAFSKFMPELGISHAPFIIMFTYIIGQYGIAKGAIKVIENSVIE